MVNETKNNKDLIKKIFDKEKEVKCFKCKVVLNINVCEYDCPHVYCKKCFKEKDDKDDKELTKGLNKIN